MASAARTQQAHGQKAAPPQPARSNATVGRTALRAAQSQQRATPVTTNTTSSATPQANLTPTQQAQAARSANAAALAQAEREQREHQAREQQRMAQLQANAAINNAKAKAAMNKIPVDMLKDFRNATNLKGVTGAPVAVGRNISPQAIQASLNKNVKPAPTPPPAPQNVATPITATPDDKLRQPYAVQPPGTPPIRPGGRGY